MVGPILAEITAFRARHGAGPLVHNNNLALQVQEFIRRIPVITSDIEQMHSRKGSVLVYRQGLDLDEDQATITPQIVINDWIKNSVYQVRRRIFTVNFL